MSSQRWNHRARTNFVSGTHVLRLRSTLSCQRPVGTLTSSRKMIQSHRSFSWIYRESSIRILGNVTLSWSTPPRARNSPAKFKFLPTRLQFYDVHFIDHFELPWPDYYISPLTFSIPSTLVRRYESTCWPHRFPPNPERRDVFTEGPRALGWERHDERR